MCVMALSNQSVIWIALQLDPRAILTLPVIVGIWYPAWSSVVPPGYS